MQPDLLPDGPLRVALLAHSVNPRGGVVHALELADALYARGHQVSVFAPGEPGRQFFRATTCRTVVVPARPVAAATAANPLAGLLAGPGGPLRALVRQRIADYVDYFDKHGCDDFDVFHAQDGISANALATLVDRGLLPGYLRTVHHLDAFDDELLMAWQKRGVDRAERLMCVSPAWQERLAAESGREVTCVGNGVDVARFNNQCDGRDAAVRERLGLYAGWKDPLGNAGLSACEGGASPLLLAVGGIESRKNTLGTLQAFLLLRRRWPSAQLVIAGGASLLDHQAYQQQFNELMQAHDLVAGPGRSVVVTGPLADAEVPALMRQADVLLFPSLNEGFGLVLLESLACGTPVVASRMKPFTEFLAPDEAAWADPHDAMSIADAVMEVLQQLRDPQRAASLRERARRTALRFPWSECARRHEGVYRDWLNSRARHTQPETAYA